MLAFAHSIPAILNNTTLLHSTPENRNNLAVHQVETHQENKKLAQLESELQDLKSENIALKKELESREAKIGMLVFDLHFAGKALKKTVAELRTSEVARAKLAEEGPTLLEQKSTEGDPGGGNEGNDKREEPADQPRRNATAAMGSSASIRLIGMEVAQRVERRKKDMLEVELATLGDQLDKEKEGRAIERETLMGEKKATEAAMEKQTTDHRQEIKVLMGQLQDAWNNGLDLTKQLNHANDNNRGLQLQLKQARDALKESKRQFLVLRSANLLLQNEVYKLRSGPRPVEASQAFIVEAVKNPRQQETASMGMMVTKDCSEVPEQVQEKGGEAEGPTVVNASADGWSSTVDGLQTTTKEAIEVKIDTPAVRLPAPGASVVLPLTSTFSANDTDTPILDTTTIEPLDIESEPEPIRVQLPTPGSTSPRKTRRGNRGRKHLPGPSGTRHLDDAQRDSSPLMSGVTHPDKPHWKTLSTQQGSESESQQSAKDHSESAPCPVPSSRIPLACITNQVWDRNETVA